MKDIKKTMYLGLGLGVKLLAGLYAVKLCAQHLGPETFGITGQLSSLLVVVSLLAGAGVSVGVTKVYAGAEFPRASRPQWIRAARWVVLSSAVLLLVLTLLLSDWITGQLLGGGEQANWLIVGLVMGILPIAYAGIGQGKITGSHRDDLYSLSLVLGSGLGLLGIWILGQNLGATGALLGMIWMVVAQALVMNLMGYFAGKDAKPETNPPLDPDTLQSKIKLLLSYGALSIAAGVIIPLAYITIRFLVQQHQGGHFFGLWQATLRISEAYCQLPLMLLTVVLFARFASTASAPLEKYQVCKTYLFLAGLMASIAIFVYFTRVYWIPIVFTADFSAMEALVPWQLAGDTLRIVSYLGTTILAARGILRVCIWAEIMQGILLLLTSVLVIPWFGKYGVYYAYIGTYFFYFILTILFLLRFGSSKVVANSICVSNINATGASK